MLLVVSYIILVDFVSESNNNTCKYVYNIPFVHNLVYTNGSRTYLPNDMFINEMHKSKQLDDFSDLIQVFIFIPKPVSTNRAHGIN